MRALRADEIKGNWATLLLPIYADDSINYRQLANEIDYLIEAAVDGIYSNGTAGEFFAQTEAEFDRINLLLAQRCEKAGMPFQIGAGHLSAHDSVQRIQRAAQMQPAAIQVILPDWKPLNDAEMIDCLQRFAGAADGIGLVLYNPPHAKRVLKPHQFAAIKAEVPQLVGIKVMDGDAQWYAAIREQLADVSIFVPGHHLATGINSGAQGAYSNVACLQPMGAQRWYEMTQTDMDAALDLEGRIQRFMNEHIVPFITEGAYSDQALDKLLATIGDWAEIGTRLKWPYQGIDIAEAERLRPIAHELLPELFAV